MDRVDGWKSVGRTQDKWKATSVSCGSWLLVSVFITWQRAIVCVRVVSYCWYHSLGRGRCDSGFTWVSKGAKHCQNRISVLNYLSRTVCRRKYRSRLPPTPTQNFLSSSRDIPSCFRIAMHPHPHTQCKPLEEKWRNANFPYLLPRVLSQEQMKAYITTSPESQGETEDYATN